MFVPSNTILPWLGFNMPDIVIRVVLFPAPFAPISATISPALTSSEIPFNASIGPYRVCTASSLSIRSCLSGTGPSGRRRQACLAGRQAAASRPQICLDHF